MVRALDAALRRLTTSGPVSAARTRQLRWVASELGRALEHPGFARYTGRDLAGLLGDPQAVDRYLELAGAGELRARASTRSASATASTRIRVDCLRLLAQAAGLATPAIQRPAIPEPRETLTSWQRSTLWHYLAAHTERWPDNPGRARAHAVIGVVLDTGVRVGELCAIRLEDLAEDLSSVTVTRRPQARSVSPTVTERVPLSEPTVVALRQWLRLRGSLVSALSGSAKALWVSVRPNHAGTVTETGPTRRPPGMPLRPRGLARAYTRTIAEINVELAGSPGWVPLPYRLEQLRRAVGDPETVEPG